MRIPTKFGHTKNSGIPRQIKSKYFLIFEGTCTEKAYFEGVIGNKEIIGIKPLIQLIPIYRSFPEQGWSNPKKILTDVIDYLEKREEKYTKSMLLSLIFDYLEDDELIKFYSEESKCLLFQSLSQFIDGLTGTPEGFINDIEDAVDNILNFLQTEQSIVSTIESIHEYFDTQRIICYEKDIDSVCLIFDRDKQSFKENQYDQVLTECKRRKYKLFISNPLFEFWLLLHFKQVLNLDRPKLLINPKTRIRSKRRFIEKELRNLLSGYKKTDIKFNLLVNRIKLAIQQEQEFCENLTQLKFELGSNIGKLFAELIDSKQE